MVEKGPIAAAAVVLVAVLCLIPTLKCKITGKVKEGYSNVSVKHPKRDYASLGDHIPTNPHSHVIVHPHNELGVNIGDVSQSRFTAVRLGSGPAAGQSAVNRELLGVGRSYGANHVDRWQQYYGDREVIAPAQLSGQLNGPNISPFVGGFQGEEMLGVGHITSVQAATPSQQINSDMQVLRTVM